MNVAKRIVVHEILDSTIDDPTEREMEAVARAQGALVERIALAGYDDPSEFAVSYWQDDDDMSIPGRPQTVIMVASIRPRSRDHK